MNRIRTQIGGLAAILLASVAAIASATTAVSPIDIAQLSARADVIVHGDVAGLVSFLDGARIHTDIHFTVTESWKGSVDGTSVRLRVYGGSFEGKRTTVIGAPCWRTGEEAVVFLVANGGDTYDILALAEGKFAVEPDGSVTRDLSGIAYAEPADVAAPGTLEALKDAVLTSLR